MSTRKGLSYTMEALALVSALCIVGIFVYAHYSRQIDDLDKQAWRLAKQVPVAAETFFQTNPSGELTPGALKQAGLQWEPPLEVEVPMDNRKALNWQVNVHHSHGNLVYRVTLKGLSEHPR